MMKRKTLLRLMLGFAIFTPLITSAYENGIYELEDEYGNAVQTIIWGDTQMTLKIEDEPGYYYWGRDVPSYDENWNEIEGREWNGETSTCGSEHNNAWGGGDDTYDNGLSPDPDNFDERQGPCDDGYHVPSVGEWNKFAIAWCNVDDSCNPDTDIEPSWNAGQNSDLIYLYRSSGLNFRNEFNMSDYDYWSSSPNPDYDYSALGLSLSVNGSLVDPNSYGGRQNYLRVRCLKNSIVAPAPQTFVLAFIDEDGVEIASGSVEDGAVRDGETPDMSGAKMGYEFLGRYEAGDPEENLIEVEAFPITKDTVFVAKFQIAQFTITFVDEDGSVIAEITQDYNTDIQKPTNPEKKGYEFIGWDIEIPDTMPAENLTITAQWKKKSSGRSGGGGGGGGSSSSHGSADDNNSQGTGDSQDSSADKSASEGQTGSQVDSSAKPQNDSSVSSGATAKDLEGEELFNMHQRAYDNGLTIYKPGEDAKFDKPLTRQQMAKISSIFGTKFLNQKADDSEGKVYECSQYTDLHKSKGEMRGYVVQSCLLGNMGYAYDGVNLIKKFKPYDKLSVAQASVILSRMTWGDKYILDSKQRYQGHMKAVYDHGLIDDISDPSRVITRGEAFTMMYRLSQLMEGEK